MMRWDYFFEVGASAGLVIATQQIIATIVEKIRTKKYRAFENRTALTVGGNESGKTPTTPAGELQGAAWQLAAPTHRVSIEKQSLYVQHVSKAATAAVMATFALATIATPLKEIHLIEVSACGIEITALLSIFWHFIRSQAVNAQWMCWRARSELLRQFGFLAVLFPSFGLPNTNDITSHFQLIEKNVADAIGELKHDELTRSIDVYWQATRTVLSLIPLSDIHLTADACAVYIRKRSWRQAEWFKNSQDRLEHSAENRAWWLKLFFALTLFLVIFKLVLLILSVPSAISFSVCNYRLTVSDPMSYLSAALIVLAGATGASTAYYFNLNARSLIHRYTVQQREIANWFDKADIEMSSEASVPDPVRKDNIRTLILEFEDLMIDELKDWLRISSHDAMELAV